MICPEVRTYLDEDAIHWEGIAIFELGHIPYHNLCQGKLFSLPITEDKKPR